MPNNVLGILSQTTNMATSAAFDSKLIKDSNDSDKFCFEEAYLIAV